MKRSIFSATFTALFAATALAQAPSGNPAATFKVSK